MFLQKEIMGPQPARHRLLVLLTFVFFTLLTYHHTLNAPFYFDDIPNIAKNPDIHLEELSFQSLQHVVSSLEGFSKRPIAHLSFALNYYFYQLNVTGYHAVNMGVHILTGFFLYLLLDITFKLLVSGSSAQESTIFPEYLQNRLINPHSVAFLSALLWLVHPIQTQSVTYIVQRMTSMAVMFYIVSLFLYVKGRMEARRWKRWFCFVGSVLLWLTALGCKEIAITLPAFVLLYEWYFFQDLEKHCLKRALFLLVGVLLLFSAIVFFYWGGNPWGAIVSGYSKWDFSMSERLLTQCRVVVYYISLLVFPHPDRLRVDYDFELSQSPIEPVTTLVSLIFLTGLVVLGIVSAGKSRFLSFAIIWFLGHLVVESTVIPLDLVFEHRLYLPSMCVLAVVPIVLIRVSKRRLMAAGLVGCIIVLLSVGTYRRNSVWADPAAFAQDSVSKSPQSPRSLNWLGLSLAEQGEYDEAVTHYAEALRLKPDFAPAHNNWGLALVEMGRYDEAISHYRAALKIRPRYPRALYGMGVAYIRKGDNEKALERFSAAVRINPNYAEALNQMGYLLAQKGSNDSAISHLAMALKIRPGYGSAHYNMAVALGLRGEVEGAISHYERALKEMPEYAEAHNNLGILLAGKGELSKATTHFSKALELNPSFEKARKNLEKAKAMMK